MAPQSLGTAFIPVLGSMDDNYDRISVNRLKARRDPLQKPPWNHAWKRNPIRFDEIARALQDSALDEPEHAWARNCESWAMEETSSRKNHVFRIAFFVKHRDAATPIILKPNGSIYDGYHRLAAAIYCGDEFILGERSDSASAST